MNSTKHQRKRLSGRAGICSKKLLGWAVKYKRISDNIVFELPILTLFEGGPDFRLWLPLFAVQGLINLGRFRSSLHSTATPKIIFSIGIGVEELG